MTLDLWEFEFEPHTLSDMVGQDALVSRFKAYVKAGHIPDLTIVGAPGTGKTLLMQCFAEELGYARFRNKEKTDILPNQFHIFDASSKRGIDDVRTTIKTLAFAPVIDNMPRIIVLDEFNYTPDAQEAMKSLMEKAAMTSRFYLLTNDPTNIIEPLISRCPIVYAAPLSFDDIKKHVSKIQAKYGLKIEEKALYYLYQKMGGDLRQIIKRLQNAAIISNFNIDIQHVMIQQDNVSNCKSVIELTLSDFSQAYGLIMDMFGRNPNFHQIMHDLYMATFEANICVSPDDNRIVMSRLRDRIADIDRHPNSNIGVQISSILNYIHLMAILPLKCPGAQK